MGAQSFDPQAMLPAGVHLHQVSSFSDARGFVAELDRTASHGTDGPAQWNTILSNARVGRGMRVHLRHTDWLVVVSGEVVLSLMDLRADAGSPGWRATITLAEQPCQVLSVPPGVLHGWYTPRHSVVINGLSNEYDPDDELEARFDDPRIAVGWGVHDPLLSERDRLAPPLDTLLDQLSRRGMSVLDSPA